MGGLLSLRKEESHFAGSHLLDPEDGSYNINYVKNYLDASKIQIIHWVQREQGLIVPKGNPYHIESLDDIVKQKIRFVNRQRGSGTRILLDYYLNKLNLNKDDVIGYQLEEFNHLSVAVAIESGKADVGLGIQAAATALGLDFVPMFCEQYDLIVPKHIFESQKFAPVLEAMENEDFRQRVQSLRGYSVQDMGQIV